MIDGKSNEKILSYPVGSYGYVRVGSSITTAWVREPHGIKYACFLYNGTNEDFYDKFFDNAVSLAILGPFKSPKPEDSIMSNLDKTSIVEVLDRLPDLTPFVILKPNAESVPCLKLNNGFLVPEGSQAIAIVDPLGDFLPEIEVVFAGKLKTTD